jgi:hypothetical protein
VTVYPYTWQMIDLLYMSPHAVSVKGMPQSRLAQMLLGPEGSWLELGLQRVDDQGLLYVTNVSLRRGPPQQSPGQARYALPDRP